MSNELNDFILDDTMYSTQINKKFANRKKFEGFNLGKIHSFIPGTIRDIYVKNGQNVKKGDTLLVLEAMKMKNNVISTIDGIVKNIYVKTGDLVPKNHLLVEIDVS